MHKIVSYAALTGFALTMAVVFGACSASDPFQQFARNLNAKNCDTQADQQAFVDNFPSLLPEAQKLQIQAAFCAGMFGSAAAPTPAPGMAPAIPAPSAAATPVAAK